MRESPTRGTRAPLAFELKSREISGLSLSLFDADLTTLQAQWLAHVGADAAAFEHEPVVIDLSQLQRREPEPEPREEGSQGALPLDGAALLDLAAVVALLRASRLNVVAVSGADAAELSLAQSLGLADASADLPRPAATPPAVRAVVQEVRVEVPAPAVPTLIVDKPLRSGQQVYAKGGDLVVLALVNHGAEVIADGNIYVYAPLRGKAIAGARGNTAARIFATSLEAELVAIAGIYRTAENPLPADVLGKPAQVRLDEHEKLVIQPLTL